MNSQTLKALFVVVCLSLIGLYSCDEETEIVTASFSFDEISISQPEGNGSVSLTLQLSNLLKEDIIINLKTIDQTASAGEDYVALDSSIILITGQIDQVITIDLIDDEDFEEDETFLLEASFSSSLITNAEAQPITITIENDDKAEVPLSSYSVDNADLRIPEDTSASIIFTVNLDTLLPQSVTVFYETVDKTALQDDDYLPLSGQLTFEAGTTQQTLTVSLVNDDFAEDTESFLLVFKDTSSVLITDSLATEIVIINDDMSIVTASFEYSVDPENTFLCYFTDMSTIKNIADVSATYSWDFAGQGSSSEENPTFEFSGEGDYLVVLTVTAVDGVSHSYSSTITVEPPKNKYASMFDQFGAGNYTADGNTDNGELRLNLTDSIRIGRVTFMYRLPIDQTEGYFNVSGNSTIADYSVVEIRIKSDPISSHGWREGAGWADEIAGENFPQPKTNEWVPVEVSWVADGINYPKFSVTMDGQIVVTDIVSATDGGSGDEEGHLNATKYGIHNLQWKFGSRSAIESDNTKRLHLDDIMLYSEDSGTEQLIFSDTFDEYNVGRAWTDTDTEEQAAPYHINSVDVEVVEEN